MWTLCGCKASPIPTLWKGYVRFEPDVARESSFDLADVPTLTKLGWRYLINRGFPLTPGKPQRERKDVPK
jgi:hypothetical protein